MNYQRSEDQTRQVMERIRDLEDYKSLCETRILELSPHHPLPVICQHLGMNLGTENDSREIESLRIDNKAMQETLRRQMLNNEEQKNYIEILKQTLDGKIGNVRVRRLLTEVMGEGTTPGEALMKLIEIAKDAEVSENREIYAKDMETLVGNLKVENEALKTQLERIRRDYEETLHARDHDMSELKENVYNYT